MFSPYVTLPTQQQPAVPHRCAICDAVAPEQSFAYDIGRSVLVWGHLTRWLPGRRLVRVPVCTRCRGAHVLHEQVRFAFTLLSIAAAILWVQLNRNLFAANFAGGALMTVAILAPAAAWSFWRLMCPDIQIHSNLFGVSYQFRGKRFFEEFCQSNAAPPSTPVETLSQSAG